MVTAFLKPDNVLLLTFIGWIGLFVYVLIVSLKMFGIKLLYRIEPFPAMIIDLALISVLVKVTGDTHSVLHPLYVVEFLFMGYFYGFKEVFTAGLLAAAGFYYASYSEHHIADTLIHVSITFSTALFIGFMSRKSTLLKKHFQKNADDLKIQQSKLSKTQNIIESLNEIGLAMSKAENLDQIAELLETYSRFINYTDKAAFIFPFEDHGVIYLKDIAKELKMTRLKINNFSKLSYQLVIEDNKTRTITDAENDEQYRRWFENSRSIPGLRDFLHDVKSLVISPNVYANEPYGLIIMANCNHTHAFGKDQMQVITLLSYSLANYLKTIDFSTKLNERYQEIVKLTSRVVDLKDHYTNTHSQQVAKYVRQIGSAYGFDEKKLEKLTIAGLLHDIGKVGLPTNLLNKPGKLTNEEFELVKKHPEYGSKLLRDMNDFKEIADWVEQHHERFNGKGYPYGLAGRDISLEGRIIAVADAFEAMTSDRPYRKAFSYFEALQKLRKNSGTQFDPDVVEKFIKILVNADTLMENTNDTVL
ncbi:HD-GYP domain-containing protein [Metallumcola ferriviriculae]|uniref:HD-GYP domain-containing protein n=1 Tax=Metallumcola ferriviriculae TaxID=3039180 RepID=A0AAU0US57_9FIRM|nr:HD-GYP domain-containing protein [Desulfitibacteraceae bacterium MK1]